MPDVTPNPPSEVVDPVVMISGLLDKEKVTPDEHVPENNAQVEGDEPTEEQVEPPEQQEQPTAEIPLEQLEAIALDVTFKGDDGNEVTEKLTVKELRDGFMKSKDYSKKTAEIARQREELGEKTRQAIDSERTAYVSQLKALQAVILETAAPELKDVNWNQLAANDPVEYIRLHNRREQISNALSQVNAKIQEVEAKQKSEKSQALQKTARETWTRLEADIPGFNQDLYQKLLKTGIEAGVSPEMANGWVDAGTMKLLHKAYLYDQMKVGTPPADKKKVAVPPPAIKPGSTAVPKQAQRQTKALTQLSKSGKVDDLAGYLGGFIK